MTLNNLFCLCAVLVSVMSQQIPYSSEDVLRGSPTTVRSARGASLIKALLSKVDFVSRYAFSTITKRTYQTSGGTRQAEKDFESLKPRNVASNSEVKIGFVGNTLVVLKKQSRVLSIKTLRKEEGGPSTILIDDIRYKD